MYAKVGDKIVVRGNRVAEPERDAVVVEVRGSNGAPPYVRIACGIASQVNEAATTADR